MRPAAKRQLEKDKEIRYIKKHPELKGHTIVLNSSFVGHNITIYA